ncbi:MAG: hypothetical protein ACRDU8_01630, partial [Egibacteraceae bacterium]
MPPEQNRRVPWGRQAPRDPWRRSPVGELSDQLLPRWFVITCVVLVPVAVVAAIAAFVAFGPDQVPVAARRPPPASALTTAVGDFNVGDSPPVPYAGVCPRLEGVQVAGTDTDQATLRRGVAGLCNVTLPPEVTRRLGSFAERDGVVRFAQFEATGVDSTAMLDADPPVVLVNARLQRTDPLWIAPLVAHDVTYLALDPAAAASAVAARRAED